jgi:hypothetical protein
VRGMIRIAEYYLQKFLSSPTPGCTPKNKRILKGSERFLLINNNEKHQYYGSIGTKAQANTVP